MTRRPTRVEVLLAVQYLVTAARLTWSASISPFTYAYWVRFVILLPLSFVVLLLDYIVAVLLFGPDPSTWVASVYFMTVAIASGALQLSIAWRIRNRPR